MAFLNRTSVFGGVIMLKNADVTFFSFADYSKHVALGVYYAEARSKTAGRTGASIDDSVTVYLFSADYVPKPGDILVKGASDFAFDAASQQTISDSMALFRALYPGFSVVKSVADMRFGGLPHIEITAR